MTAVQQLPEFLLAVSCPTLVLVLPCYCTAILYRWISLSCTQAVSQHVPSCSSSLSVSLGPEVWVWPGLSALWPGLQHLTGSWHPWPNCGPLPASVSCTLPSERWWRSAGPDASYWWAQPSPYSTTSECLRSKRNIYMPHFTALIWTKYFKFYKNLQTLYEIRLQKQIQTRPILPLFYRKHAELVVYHPHCWSDFLTRVQQSVDKIFKMTVCETINGISDLESDLNQEIVFVTLTGEM